MKLPADLFREITGCHGEAIDVPRHDKRRAARIPVGSKASAVPASGPLAGVSLPVQVREISVLGIGLLHPAEADLGAEFVVRLTKASGDAVSIRCSAVRTRRIGKTLAATGACFVRLVEEEQRPAAAVAAVSDSDRREAERIQRALLS